MWVNKTFSSIAINSAYGNLYLAYGNLYLGSTYWVFPYKPSTASGLVVTLGQCEWDTGASWGSVTHIYSDQVKVYVTDIAQRPAGPVYFQAHVFGKWK